MIEKFRFCHLGSEPLVRLSLTERLGKRKFSVGEISFMHILCFLLACAQSVLILTPLYFWLKACIKSFYVFNMRSHTDLKFS